MTNKLVLDPLSTPKNREAVRLGRRFAGSIASKLDAHPGSNHSHQQEEEKKLLELARGVLRETHPDPASLSFLTQAVEMHTKQFGFSKTLYDELYQLHAARRLTSTTPVSEKRELEPSKARVTRRIRA